MLTLSMALGSYSQATVCEETIEKMNEEFREIECVLNPIPFSVNRQRNQNNEKTTINTVEHIQGSRPHKGRSTTPSKSLNWSGYASLTNLDNPKNYSVQKVSGSWTVPTLTGTEDNSYSIAWVGIDGYFDNETAVTVEQIGTAQFWHEGVPYYFAWFEMYGPITSGGLNEIQNFPVSPGDEIFTLAKYVDDNTFSLRIYNITQKTFVKIPESYTFQPLASRTSAEWIVEAPTDSSTGDVLPLANFGTIKFTDCETTIRHINGSISNKHWENSAITMVDSAGDVKAQPSPLSRHGKAFSITWVSED